MCLAAIALDESRRFPLVVAANRDEFFERPSARMTWWSAGTAQPDILGGRDLRDGGTWMGLTAAGRLALLTNIRQPELADPKAPTRGQIVPLWLRGGLPTDQFWTRVALSGYNGFNLIAADFLRGECFWASSRHTHPKRLERGIYGVSNADLDTPWPKVLHLKSRLGAAIDQADDAARLAASLFEALGDRSHAPEHLLPATGIPIERERQLSAAHIRTPDNVYGTRCSTVIVTERLRRHSVTHVFERTYTPGSALALMRQVTLKDWPPRYVDGRPPRASLQSEVVEAAPGDGVPLLSADEPRRRVRSLLMPATPPRPRTRSTAPAA